MKPAGDHMDADLVASLNRGERKGFEAIYRKYIKDLYSFARKNVHVKEDCEEILQEVFESLWRRHQDIRIEISLRAYLFSMVRFSIIRYFQKSASRRRLNEHYMLFEGVYQTGQEDMDPLIMKVALDKALPELPERCRMALNLRLTENLSNSDIAERMNINRRTVETYMGMAFCMIRSLYKEYNKQG